MRFSLATACAVVSIMTLSAVAGAQQSNQPSATSGATAAAEVDTLKDTVALPAWPKASVELSGDSQPVPTSFALGAVEGIDPNLLTGVTADGFARKVKVENQAIGQVLITTVSKGEKQAAVGDEGLTAQFDASEVNALFPEKNLTVEGSKAALVAALNALNQKDEKEEKKAADASEALVANTGSGGSSNDVASSYSPPKISAATEDDPVVTYRTTTDQCKARIGDDAVYVQDRTETITDGVVTDSGTCSDNGTTFAIKKSYLTCGDKFDADLTKAWAQYTRYYTDSNGETRTISECEYDAGEFFAITEDESQCPISIDWELDQAVPQSALVYTNRNNKVVQARGCEPSTKTAPVQMTETTAGCTLRHDYAAKKSYEQSMWTHVLGGVTYTASGCVDNGNVYEQQTVYRDTSGDYICKVLTDVPGGIATLQSRVAIVVGGQTQYLTDCTPDTATKQVVATTEGCMDPTKWEHDLSAGVSYGQQRFYFTQADNSRYYVTACQTSAKTYQHQTEITGYEPHDAQLFAYPLETVTIDVGGMPYTVAKNALLDGSPQIVYTQADPAFVDRQNGSRTDEGCNAYFGTTRYEQWERPDGTVYEKANGNGAPVGPSDVCSSTTEMANYYHVTYSSYAASNNPYAPINVSTPTANYYTIQRAVRTNPKTAEVFYGTATIVSTQNVVAQFFDGPYASNSGNSSDVCYFGAPCYAYRLYWGGATPCSGKAWLNKSCGWTNSSENWAGAASLPGR